MHLMPNYRNCEYNESGFFFSNWNIFSSCGNIFHLNFSVIAGLSDGEINGQGVVTGGLSNTLTCSNVTIDHTDEPYGHWAVCKYPECPIVRVTTTDELCNYYR